MTTIRATELVLDSPLSVGLLRSPSMLNKELFSLETIVRESFVVAVQDSDHAAKQDSVLIKTLAGEPFIVPPRQPGWDYADTIFQILRENAVEPRIVQEARQALAVVSLVAGGLGVALVPASFSNVRLPGVTYRPIKVQSLTTDLAMVLKRNSRASTLRVFLDVVRAEYPKR